MVLRCHRSPGDIVVLTGVARDLAQAHAGQIRVLVDTSCRPLWRHNPQVGLVRGICDYPRTATIVQVNCRPPRNPAMHYLDAMRQQVGDQLGLEIPATTRCGALHLSPQEQFFPPLLHRRGLNLGDPYWVIVAGGKDDMTTKWWHPGHAQDVVDQLRGRVRFVQCGLAEHHHQRLAGVIDLIGRTSLRQFLRVIYHAAGVLCPVTFAMHAAAAVPAQTDRPRRCVVVAGGRESPVWERYPGHDYLHTIGELECCADQGCWRSVCQPTPRSAGMPAERRCVEPVQVRRGLQVPKCMEIISAERVTTVIDSR